MSNRSSCLRIISTTMPPDRRADAADPIAAVGSADLRTILRADSWTTSAAVIFDGLSSAVSSASAIFFGVAP